MRKTVIARATHPLAQAVIKAASDTIVDGNNVEAIIRGVDANAQATRMRVVEPLVNEGRRATKSFKASMSRRQLRRVLREARREDALK